MTFKSQACLLFLLFLHANCSKKKGTLHIENDELVKIRKLKQVFNFFEPMGILRIFLLQTFFTFRLGIIAQIDCMIALIINVKNRSRYTLVYHPSFSEGYKYD